MRWIRWISRCVSRNSRNNLQSPLDWTCADYICFSPLISNRYACVTITDHSWRLVFVGKLVVGVLGCYHVLERVGFLPRIHWYCHCFLYYFLRISLGHFPRPIPSLRKLFITLPLIAPKTVILGEFLSMTGRDQRCVKIISPIVRRWFP